VKTEALAKLGELLQAMPKATGGAKSFRAVPGKNRSARCLHCREIYTLDDGHVCPQSPPTYADLHLDKKTAMVGGGLPGEDS
jgi:hypothetical protein